MNVIISSTNNRYFNCKSIGSAFVFVTITCIVSTVYADGILFGSGRRYKASNPQGVSSINVHMCNSLECPPVRIVEGKCDKEHMSMHWGVCVCNEGYVEKNGACVEPTDEDVGICGNGNVYLSYMSDPCATETPMTGRTCTSDNDCEGGSWTDNTGCCDTTLNKCKAWIYHKDDNGEEIFTCPKENNRSCKKNSDCNGEEFCNLVSTKWNCEKPDTGTCTPIGISTPYTYINETNKTFWAGSDNLTWWAAENWCKAQGKTLVSYATVNGLFDCDKGSGSCNWDTNTTHWKNDNILPYYYYWTSESSDSCNAWSVGVGVGDVFTSYDRYYDDIHTLCE